MELVLMQDADIFVKTDAGRDEIKSRALGLPMSIRAILLMIDGQRSVAEMRSIIAGSKAPADVLDGLVVQGLIEPRSGPASVARVAPPATAPVPAPTPQSISMPRTAQRATGPTPTGAATISGNSTSFVYDGPLDLTLPTIDGPEAPAAQPVAAAATDATPPVNRYEQLYAMMNEIVRDFLSPTRRYFFQLKIERCGTPEELLELLHDLQAALAKARGDAFAAEVISRLRSATS